MRAGLTGCNGRPTRGGVVAASRIVGSVALRWSDCVRTRSTVPLDVPERRALDLGGEPFEPAHARSVVSALILAEQEADAERVGQRNLLELACGIQRHPGVPRCETLAGAGSEGDPGRSSKHMFV